MEQFTYPITDCPVNAVLHNTRCSHDCQRSTINISLSSGVRQTELGQRPAARHQLLGVHRCPHLHPTSVNLARIEFVMATSTLSASGNVAIKRVCSRFIGYKWGEEAMEAKHRRLHQLQINTFNKSRSIYLNVIDGTSCVGDKICVELCPEKLVCKGKHQ